MIGGLALRNGLMKSWREEVIKLPFEMEAVIFAYSVYGIKITEILLLFADNFVNNAARPMNTPTK